MKLKCMLPTLLFLSGCQTCLTEKEIDKRNTDKTYVNKNLSSLNGVYKEVLYSPWGQKVEGKCKVFVRDGVVKTSRFGSINIVDPKLIWYFGEETAFEFTDTNSERFFQLYLNKDSFDLVSVDFWLTLIRVEEENV